MRISGWGRLPWQHAVRQWPRSAPECAELLQRARRNGNSVLARGQGRSYGDSSLHSQVLELGSCDHYLSFDADTGILEAEAGLTLAEVLRLIVPNGWFLPVTPGTQFVSLGGAVASDVHGKNHHVDGSLSRHILDFTLMTGTGEILRCSSTDHADLFRATCGGMGLTGIVMTVRLQLRRIASSDMHCRTLRLHGLEPTLEAFERYADSTYSVAWIDCLATGSRLGRSVLMLGEHADNGVLLWSPPAHRTIPSAFPARLLNAVTIRCFNSIYYHRPLRADSTLSYQPFFYPLDGLRHWNRMYGARGFMQYQFVMPLQSGSAPLRAILERIARSGLGSFLAVLKRLGPGNDHPLSFPMQGMSLALDFRFDARLPALLTELDAIVDAHGGRVYLTKDARLSVASFRSGYPQWQQFQEIRARYGALGRFASSQSVRLALE